MVQTGMTSPYPAAFPTQNGNQGDPPLKPVSVSDMKSDLVGPTGDKGGGGGGIGGGGGGGGQVVNAQGQAVTNGQMQMANGEPTTQNASTVSEFTHHFSRAAKETFPFETSRKARHHP